MFDFERRWGREILEAFAPPGGPGVAPAEGEIDYEGWLEVMTTETNPLAANGLRAAITFVHFAPPLVGEGARTFSSMSIDERARVLDAMLRDKRFAVRELALLLKIQASMALFGAASVRESSGYERKRGVPQKIALRLARTEEVA